MSLKNIFDLINMNHSSENVAPGLKQGRSYNMLQHKIEQGLGPQTRLINQTTSPNLGSITEGFVGLPEKPLSKIKQAELDKITDLENDFDRLVTQYTTKHHEFLKNPPSSGSAVVNWYGNADKGDVMTDCSQYTSSVGPYKDEGGQYLADACQYGYDKGGCAHFDGDGSVRFWERKACGTGEALKKSQSKERGFSAVAHLNTLFSQVQEKASELRDATRQLSGKQRELIGKDGVLKNQKKANLEKIKNLEKHQNELTRLMNEKNALEAEINDNTLQVNSTYVGYIFWLIAAITLGLIAVKKSTK